MHKSATIVLSNGIEITVDHARKTYAALEGAALRRYKVTEIAELSVRKRRQLLADLKACINILGLTEMLQADLIEEEPDGAEGVG